MQEVLWNLHPHLTEHHAGKLELCIGMPIMIKNNEATECGVTNGAEAEIVGWKSKPLTNDKDAVETLFVKLTSPPNAIQIEGLPENVIPICPFTKVIRCKMPNGRLLNISRTQVPILPNFAMTDFGSQGRTRINNIVDLQNCRNHQSVYTCLSRGATVDGTIIVQSFDSKKLTGGIPGNLRQEFRDIELLDEITKLRWERKIPSHISGITRAELIHSYRKWKGHMYMPESMHSALKWTVTNPYPLESPEQNIGMSKLSICIRPRRGQ